MKNANRPESQTILHIPHAGLDIPTAYLGDILVSDVSLHCHVFSEADLYVNQLFAANDILSLQPSFSRLVCDVERFRNDAQEQESKRGRGLFYTHFDLTGEQFRLHNHALREKIVTDLYDPHHAALLRAVAARLQVFGCCRILDCHSFPDMPGHPDFCIGTDPYHTPDAMRESLQQFLEQKGYFVRVNFPYSGSIVPMPCYQTDSRVQSIMIEVNKRLYLDEATFAKKNNFAEIRQICLDIVSLIAISAVQSR